METPRAYYNEFDTGAAAWLRELIAEGHLPAGDVDTRSISDVTADDVRGYTQCHFFAGIGGWPYALRLAGWPDDRPVWTGSCPCQPYSSAGKGLGDADARNLWPVFFQLIRECRPVVTYGEQVEAAIRHGWLDTVSADLEREGYAVGAAVLGAHSVGAPHIRQRLYWVADAHSGRGKHNDGPRESDAQRHGTACRVADADTGRQIPHRISGNTCCREQAADKAVPSGSLRRVPDANSSRLQAFGPCSNWTRTSGETGVHRATYGFWHAAEFIPCRDGKARPVEPGIFPLAHGIPGRVALLRGAGNAIVPQVAAAFVRAWRDVTE